MSAFKDSTGITHYEIPSFKFTTGQTLSIRLAYRSYNPKSPKIALVPTHYGGRINGAVAFKDTGDALSSHHIIVVATLGNGESSSPSNTPDFPKTLDYRDCVNAEYELLKHLGINELDAVVGYSMGAQQAYYWACMYPQFVKNIVVISASAKTSGHNYAFLEGPKVALTASAEYADGEYKAKDLKPSRGLRAFGRAYAAWLTSGAWFRERLWEEELGYPSIEAYLKGSSEKSFEDFDAEDVLVGARMWQAADVGTTREDGDTTKALEAIQARVLLMPCRTDQYFVVADSEAEMKHLKKGQLAVIESSWGHAAGGGMSLDDTDWLSERIGKFLQ
ncbi:hypothetical protein MMC28_000282 [Mycoblastus sanguinarius]|nr:hypothetical protein [Mycoblastus sanguinarius]